MPQGLAQNLASKKNGAKYIGIAENGGAAQGQPGGRPGGELPQGLAQNLARLSVKPQGTNGQVKNKPITISNINIFFLSIMINIYI